MHSATLESYLSEFGVEQRVKHAGRVGAITDGETFTLRCSIISEPAAGLSRLLGKWFQHVCCGAAAGTVFARAPRLNACSLKIWP
jgi:hypothetical protein